MNLAVNRRLGHQLSRTSYQAVNRRSNLAVNHHVIHHHVPVGDHLSSPACNPLVYHQEYHLVCLPASLVSLRLSSPAHNRLLSLLVGPALYHLYIRVVSPVDSRLYSPVRGHLGNRLESHQCSLAVSRQDSHHRRLAINQSWDRVVSHLWCLQVFHRSSLRLCLVFSHLHSPASNRPCNHHTLLVDNHPCVLVASHRGDRRACLHRRHLVYQAIYHQYSQADSRRDSRRFNLVVNRQSSRVHARLVSRLVFLQVSLLYHQAVHHLVSPVVYLPDSPLYSLAGGHRRSHRVFHRQVLLDNLQGCLAVLPPYSRAEDHLCSRHCGQ